MVGNITWHAHSSNITVDGRFEPVLEKLKLTGDATFKGDGEFGALSDLRQNRKWTSSHHPQPTTPRPQRATNYHPTNTPATESHLISGGFNFSDTSVADFHAAEIRSTNPRDVCFFDASVDAKVSLKNLTSSKQPWATCSVGLSDSADLKVADSASLAVNTFAVSGTSAITVPATVSERVGAGQRSHHHHHHHPNTTTHHPKRRHPPIRPPTTPPPHHPTISRAFSAIRSHSAEGGTYSWTSSTYGRSRAASLSR